MQLLQIPLIILSGCGCAFMAYVALVEQTNSMNYLTISYAVGLAINTVYLVATRHTAQKPSSRVSRLVSLWFEAKERELERRAKG